MLTPFRQLIASSKRNDASSASAQQSTMLPVYGPVVKSPQSILPNGTAPIGSEMKEKKQRQISEVVDLSGFVFPDGELDIESSLERAGLLLPADKTNVQKASSAKLDAKTTPEKTAASVQHSSGVQKADRNDQASEQCDSDKSFRNLCGLSLQEFNEQKAAGAAQKDEKDDSEG